MAGGLVGAANLFEILGDRCASSQDQSDGSDWKARKMRSSIAALICSRHPTPTATAPSPPPPHHHHTTTTEDKKTTKTKALFFHAPQVEDLASEDGVACFCRKPPAPEPSQPGLLVLAHALVKKLLEAARGICALQLEPTKGCVRVQKTSEHSFIRGHRSRQTRYPCGFVVGPRNSPVHAPAMALRASATSQVLLF